MSRKKCPTCGQPEAEAHRPFCSQRCAEVDLGHWLTGRYLIPGAKDELDPGAPRPEKPDPGED